MSDSWVDLDGGWADHVGLGDERWQVSSLQERLENLQVTMLDVMNKYGNLKRLEVAFQSNNAAGDQHLQWYFFHRNST